MTMAMAMAMGQRGEPYHIISYKHKEILYAKFFIRIVISWAWT